MSELDIGSSGTRREFRELLENLGLKRGLEEHYFYRASMIQQLVITKGEVDRCCVIQAKAGMGKTLAFACSVLEKLVIESEEEVMVRILIISPTREIAHQTSQVFKNISKYLQPVAPVIGTFIGGIDITQDRDILRRCHIAVGTPGRLKALITSKYLRTESITTLILDEADKLVEDKFISDVSFISDTIEKKRVIAASATFESSLLDVLETKFLSPNPQYFMVDGDDIVLEDIQQYYFKVKPNSQSSNPNRQLLKYHLFRSKADILVQILSRVKFYQAIVFLNNQARSTELIKKLEISGWPAAYTSGKLDQKERMEAMDQTRRFNVRVLVCSDLISRGVDVERVDLVINMDLPQTLDTYLHRVGRTGRFGSKGLVVSLVDHQEDEKSLNILKESLGPGFLELDKIETLSSSGRSLKQEDVVAFSKLKVIEAKSKSLLQAQPSQDTSEDDPIPLKEPINSIPTIENCPEETFDDPSVKVPQKRNHFDESSVKAPQKRNHFDESSDNPSKLPKHDEQYEDHYYHPTDIHKNPHDYIYYPSEEYCNPSDSQFEERVEPGETIDDSFATPTSGPSDTNHPHQAPQPQYPPPDHPNPFHTFWLNHFAHPHPR